MTVSRLNQKLTQALHGDKVSNYLEPPHVVGVNTRCRWDRGASNVALTDNVPAEKVSHTQDVHTPKRVEKTKHRNMAFEDYANKTNGVNILPHHLHQMEFNDNFTGTPGTTNKMKHHQGVHVQYSPQRGHHPHTRGSVQLGSKHGAAAKHGGKGAYLVHNKQTTYEGALGPNAHHAAQRPPSTSTWQRTKSKVPMARPCDGATEHGASHYQETYKAEQAGKYTRTLRGAAGNARNNTTHPELLASMGMLTSAQVPEPADRPQKGAAAFDPDSMSVNDLLQAWDEGREKSGWADSSPYETQNGVTYHGKGKHMPSGHSGKVTQSNVHLSHKSAPADHPYMTTSLDAAIHGRHNARMPKHVVRGLGTHSKVQLGHPVRMAVRGQGERGQKSGAGPPAGRAPSTPSSEAFLQASHSGAVTVQQLIDGPTHQVLKQRDLTRQFEYGGGPLGVRGKEAFSTEHQSSFQAPDRHGNRPERPSSAVITRSNVPKHAHGHQHLKVSNVTDHRDSYHKRDAMKHAMQDALQSRIQAKLDFNASNGWLWEQYGANHDHNNGSTTARSASSPRMGGHTPRYNGLDEPQRRGRTRIQNH